MTTRKSKNYIDNKTLYNEIVAWYASGKEDIPDKIVLGVMQICNRLGTKSNFKGYTWIDEMVAGGLESCILALKYKKFDPNKSNNPFAYFTQIAWNNFIQVINEEKKQSYVKHKALEHHMMHSALNGEPLELSVEDTRQNADLVEKFEKKKTKNE